MRAVLIEGKGEPVADRVRLVDDHPDPEPAAGEVLVRTEAAALNQLDLWIGRGVPGLELKYPVISGSDGAGIVEAVGGGVDEAWIGRRIMLNAAIPQDPACHPDRPPPAIPELQMIGEHLPGCMAEYFVAPAPNLFDVGPDADPVAAAAFGLTFLTAWRMIVSRAELVAGQLVLITGIGGGVALAALSICRHFGCRTIVTSRHQHKLDRALELGADHAVLDVGEDFSKVVRGHTLGRGVDLCVDSIGKAVHESCMKSLAVGGTFVTCGCTSGPLVTTSLARMFWLQLRIVGSTMGNAAEFHEVASLFRSGDLLPVIDSVHDADNAKDAYARLESGDQFGKVVVRFG